jgi:hypothetical protein
MAPSEPKKEKKERTLTGLHVRKNLRRMASGGSRKDEDAENEDLLRADRAEAAAAAADAWLCEARLAHGREVAARAAADCDNRDALDRAEAATVAATAALELERRRASVLSDEKRVLIAEVKRLRGAADAAAQDAATARADRQRLKNERRALARELQATRTALAAASKAPPPAPPRAPPPRPRASSSEDPEDAVVLEMLGIC